jgi:hypothetical protein
MRYVVEIDELVLHGFGMVDRRRVSAGLREELGRLLIREGAPTQIRDRARIDGGHFAVTPGDDRATGRGIARRAFAGLRR